MTRFARAKGSKASNERLPEEATSWEEMRMQMQKKEQETEDATKRKEVYEKRDRVYKEFLDDGKQNKVSKAKNTWADFSDVHEIKRAPKVKSVVQTEVVTEALMSAEDSDKHKKKLERRKKQKEKRLQGILAKKELEVSEEKVLSKQQAKKLKKKKDKAAANNNEEVSVGKSYQKPKLQLPQNDNTLPSSNTVEKLPKNMTPDNNPAPQKLLSQQSAKSVPKQRKAEKQRRKEQPQPTTLSVNGRDIEVSYCDGFPVRKEDGERIAQLRKQMISKGLPRSEVNRALKLERRRAEKALTREKRKVCFNCRQFGHGLAECPSARMEEKEATGICFTCGSTEHSYLECKLSRSRSTPSTATAEFKFATCFICREQGHVARQCPENTRGVYPKGGCCNECGDVTHLRKDCPRYQGERQAQGALHAAAEVIDGADVEGLVREDSITRMMKKEGTQQQGSKVTVVKF